MDSTHGAAHPAPHGAQEPAPAQHGVSPEAASPSSLADLTPEAEAALWRALTAYLAVGDGLASDRFEGASDQARRLGAALSELSAVEVRGDPHFWHERAALLATLDTQVTALQTAGDLAAARQAFGQLGPAFAELLRATGTPEGMALRRFTCGMYQQAPEGGVWIQAGPEARNPFFGSQMLMCHRDQQPLPTRAEGAPQREPVNPEGHH